MKVRGLVIVAAAVLICLAVYVYNEIIYLEHLIHNSHGRIEAEIQRRHDVVARCRDAAGNYMAIEEKIQNQIIIMNGIIRSGGNNAAYLKEKEEIIALLRDMDMIKEKYPALKSKKPSVFLMEVIQEAGGRVTRERLNYNEWVYRYNKMRMVFPYRTFAWILRFKEKPFLSEKI